MKQKLANYIAETLVKNGITQNFTVTGGGAMHLNDAFGHQKGMYSLYQHHEQACAMAAESYARIYNRPALCCVTSGPGGTNAITGVLGAWLDSLPMIVISGQVRFDNTARWSGVDIRAMGDQEYDIVQAVSCMCKYAEMLIDPMRVRYAVEKCIYLSQTGRPGPCWLDIPVNIQGTYIETDDLEGFDPEAYEREQAAKKGTPEARYANVGDPEVPFSETRLTDSAVLRAAARRILDHIRQSERPVFYTGNGIRIAGAESLFLEVAHRLNIPVVVGWNAPDVIPTEDPLYAGRPGGRGDRPGNLTVQNADLVLSIGSRLNIRQVGYNFRTWARDAYVIVNDIDPEELKKPSVHADMRICADARALLKAMLAELKAEGIDKAFAGGHGMKRADAESICHTEAAKAVLAADRTEGERISWLSTAAFYRENYPTVLPEYLEDSHSEEELANVYALIDKVSRASKEDQVTVVGNGSPCVAGGQAYIVKKGARFISQDGVAAMGYDLPAAIGAWAAVLGPDHENTLEKGRQNPYWAGKEEQYPDHGAHDIILLTGDGSIQMNLQELQTIIHHQMDIKIFVINNGGYHSIRQTQNSFFGKPLVGIGVDSGVDGVCDLSFPDMEKLAAAYGFPFKRVSKNEDLDIAIEKTLAVKGPMICEVMVTMEQQFLPKSAAKKLPDGSLVSPPLEDMAPFLPEDEMDKLMLVAREK